MGILWVCQSVWTILTLLYFINPLKNLFHWSLICLESNSSGWKNDDCPGKGRSLHLQNEWIWWNSSPSLVSLWSFADREIHNVCVWNVKTWDFFDFTFSNRFQQILMCRKAPGRHKSSFLHIRICRWKSSGSLRIVNVKMVYYVTLNMKTRHRSADVTLGPHWKGVQRPHLMNTVGKRASSSSF